MRKRLAICLGTMALAVAIASAPIAGFAGVLEHIQTHFNSEPPTLTQVARMIDCIQEDIMDQGTVVIKQPDIWSQARMTKFRKEFEDTMQPEVNNFADYLSAQIARSDSAAFSSQTALGASLVPTGQAPSVENNPAGTTPPASAPAADFTFLNAASANAAGKVPTPPANLKYGLEPNVHLDEKADYITHLHRLRRINLGDDTADSAGYGLYLMRVPVSIQPGDKTVKGYGALVNITMQHDFNPKFLEDTYRNLVINDVVDLLTPVVHELIRSGRAFQYNQTIFTYLDAKSKEELDNKQTALTKVYDSVKQANALHTVGRTGTRTFAIAPSDVKRIFVPQNLLNLAYAAQVSLDLGNSGFPGTNRVKSTDVGAYLRRELESAYDLMEGRCHEEPPLLMDVDYIEKLTDQVYRRKYEGPKGAVVDSQAELNDFYTLYESFTHRLPGNLRFRPIGVLCWGIALEAGLLNRQLRKDMADTKDSEGNVCPFNVENLHFYAPTPTPEAITAFNAYVKARWPMITFALEPVTDQQNIEDAYTRRRDLQLAVAFALSSGQITFKQAINYTRTLQYEAQTIALNQTVAGFAHGNDTFGWRITPRFQTPPDESNLRAVTNLILRGGPGPNYGLKNSKIEPGLREMTAVVVMPSFVQAMKLDVANNWFRLHDPDDFKLRTAHSVDLGRRINEARLALDSADTCGAYRPQDVERLRARLHQLEAMLPLQTARVKVPYENTLGGFALFTQGATALIPEVSGYEGIDYFVPSKSTDLILYGKHFSIYETTVVVGGVALSRIPANPPPASGSGGAQDKGGGNAATPAPAPPSDSGYFDILSREVLRLHIPPNVIQTATREDGSVVVEVSVSTPTGISNRVQIPVLPAAAKTGAFVPAPTGTGLASVSSPGSKLPGGNPAAASFLAQGVSPSTIPLPNPFGASRDPLTRPAAFESLVPSMLQVTGQVPPPPSASVPPEIAALQADLKSLNDKTDAALKALNEKTATLSTAVIRSIPSPQSAPVVNVAVPVTNMPQPAKHHQGLFHRKPPATPQNPTKPPLLQRLMSP